MNANRILMIAGILAGGAAGATGFAHWNGGSGGRCDQVGRAILQANEAEAEAAFWITLAGCLNDPAANLPACWQEAEDEREDAEDEAEEQYAARLAVCARLGHGVYDPRIRPAHFSSNVTNPYFPLAVGRVLVYEKMTSEGLEQLTVEALNETIDIGGVECRVVRAVESLDGELVEDTRDWFAQERDGDVWYFGEIVLNYEDGFLEDLGGSWRYGKDGALPGILMPAAPAVGDAYRQEFLVNVAEDVAEVVATGLTITVPAGTFTQCVQTRDGSPIEPGNFEFKYYAPGVGLIAEEDPASGERLELVQIL